MMSQLESEALDTAFIHAFANLFDNLISGMITGDVKGSVERFERGFNIQRDAYVAVREIIDSDDDKAVPR